MRNRYNQYYRQQKSNANPVNNPEDEIKQDSNEPQQNPENTVVDNEQQSNGVINSEDTQLDNENQQNPDDNAGSNPEPPAKPIEGYVTDCLKLNIRKEPSLNADILCEVPVNAKLAIAPDTSSEEWLSVVTDTGVNGFCMAKYVNIK